MVISWRVPDRGAELEAHSIRVSTRIRASRLPGGELTSRILSITLRPAPGECVPELLNALGDSIGVGTVLEDAFEPL